MVNAEEWREQSLGAAELWTGLVYVNEPPEVPTMKVLFAGEDK